MNVYFISDLHLFHKNIIQLSNRPFSSLEDMHKTIIDNWNHVVKNKDDKVYIVGDVALGKPYETAEILKQLNGIKILIKGNHDHKNLKTQAFKNCFEEIVDYKELLMNNQLVILSHYPFEEWNGFFRNSIHLYGHVHINDKNLKKIQNRYNVGIDIIHKPCTLKEIIERNKK